MDFYTGGIAIFGFNFAPYGWASCAGQIVPIAQNTALFALLGTNFGGDGRSTFGLPNLQGRAAVGAGQGPGLQQWDIGETGGNTTHTMLMSEMPAHTHALTMSMPYDASGNPGDANTPVNNYLSQATADIYTSATGTNMYLSVAPGNLVYTDPVGSSAPFSIMRPSLVMNYSICLYGIFPQRP